LRIEFFGGTRRKLGGSSQLISTGGKLEAIGAEVVAGFSAAALGALGFEPEASDGSGVLRQPKPEPSATAPQNASTETERLPCHETVQIPRVNWATMLVPF
jgi:hypothetical protein